MTVDDVRQMAEHLCAQGVTPAGNSLVAYAHASHRPLSKRTALKHLQALAAQGVTFTPPPPIERADDVTMTLEPVEFHPGPAVDPVARAEQALKQAEGALMDARDALLHAKLQLLATRTLAVDSVLHGTLASAR
jgi:hypothetical protein